MIKFCCKMQSLLVAFTVFYCIYCTFPVLQTTEWWCWFDTVDHNILLNRLETWVGLHRTVLKWYRLYLEKMCYFVTIWSVESDRMAVRGVPQGSVLGLIIFTLYMLPLGQMLQNANVGPMAMQMTCSFIYQIFSKW